VVQVVRDDATYVAVDVRVKPGRTVETIVDGAGGTETASVPGAPRAVRSWVPTDPEHISTVALLAEIADGRIVETGISVYVGDWGAFDDRDTDAVLGSLRIDPEVVRSAIGW
jgi:hypothetical protein